MLLKLWSSSLFYREHTQACQEHFIAESQQTEISIIANKHGKETSYNQQLVNRSSHRPKGKFRCTREMYTLQTSKEAKFCRFSGNISTPMYLKQHVLLILHRHNLRNSSQEKDVAVFKFARKAQCYNCYCHRRNMRCKVKNGCLFSLKLFQFRFYILAT